MEIIMKSWHHDIHDMHAKYGVHDWMEKNKNNKDLMQKFLDFRAYLSNMHTMACLPHVNLACVC